LKHVLRKTQGFFEEAQNFVAAALVLKLIPKLARKKEYGY
jgi:hypothetical protein